MIWKKSLVARLVLAFLALSSITAIAMGSIAFFQARRALEDSILDRLGVAAELKEDALSQWVIDQEQDFLLLAEMPSIQALSLPPNAAETPAESPVGDSRLVEIMKSAIARNTHWREIQMLSSKGEIQQSTERGHVGDYRVRDRYFVEGLEHTYVQKVYPSPVTFKPIITIATPLPDSSGAPRGVLALHLDLERMDEILLERSSARGHSESYLVDQYNVLISGKRFGREEYPRGVHSVGIDAALQGIDGSGLYESYNGVPVIGVYRWIDDLEVALLTEIPQAIAFAPARRLVWAMVAVGFLIATVLTFVIYLVALQIARPVLSVTRAAVRVAEGDLTSQAPVLTTDEVGVLALTFNQMTERLRVLYEDLELEIAERKRAETQREELITELEGKNAELERFAYTVSHDLKSPLVTIQGFLGLLKKDVQRGDAPRVAHNIRRIRNAAKSMQRLLDDLLELSRLGRLVNPLEKIELAELTTEALELVTGSLAQVGVEVVVEAQMPEVHGDRIRLLEVLQNLIENAIKAVGEESHPRIEIGGREVGEEVVCTVRDNGLGIDPRYHQKIFGLFNQLDQSVEGTGVGLALVKRIVELHGGRIWVESELGHGATFFLALPRELSAMASMVES